jgi:hypothetical protein
MMIDDLGPEKPLEWISIDPVGRYRFRNNKSNQTIYIDLVQVVS